MMDMTAVTTFVNKKQMPGIKRVRSIASNTTQQSISKYIKTTTEQSDINKTNVRDYFLHERPFANVQIVLDQQTIWCDKASLAAASPIFREQFLHNNNNEQLMFDDIQLDHFLAMLEFIYPIFDPEINERNITCLIELSHRFRFDVLKYACQFYVMRHLSTMKRVLSKCRGMTSEGNSSSSNNNNNNNNHNNYSRGIDENEYQREANDQCDLIEFRNQTCVDAMEIITNLCRWLKTYFHAKNTITTSAIIGILRQISVNYLERAIITSDIDDELESYIYKERAQYLELSNQPQHIC